MSIACHVFDSLSTPARIVGTDGHILAVNMSWRAFGADNGLAPGFAVPGSSYTDICHAVVGPDRADAQRFLAGLRGVQSGTCAYFEMDYECSGPDRPRWCQAVITPLVGSDAVLVVHAEVTERIVAMRRVQENEHFAEIASRAAQVGGWFYERGAGQVDWSPAVADIFGVEHGTRPPLREVFALVKPYDRRRLADAVLACFRRGSMCDLVIDAVTVDGRDIVLHVVAKALPLQPGRARRVQGACKDITARKRAEALAVRTDARLRTTLETLPVEFFLVDYDYRVIYVNPVAAQVTRIDAAGLGPWRWDVTAGRPVVSGRTYEMLGLTSDRYVTPQLWPPAASIRSAGPPLRRDRRLNAVDSRSGFTGTGTCVRCPCRAMRPRKLRRS